MFVVVLSPVVCCPQDKHSPVLVQELMSLCWHPNPDLRPDMNQCKQWASSDEFDRLRANITLSDVSSVACACVSHIDPGVEGSTTSPQHQQEEDGFQKTLSLHSEILQPEKDEEEWEVVQGPSSRTTDSATKSGGDSYAASQEDLRSPLASGNTPEETRKRELGERGVEAYTQVWMCGRDKKKGLLAVFLFPDNQKSYSVSARGV